MLGTHRWVLIGACSSGSHRLFDPLSLFDGAHATPAGCPGGDGPPLGPEVLPHRGRVQRPRETQGPRERTTALGELETTKIGVQPRPPARQRPAHVDHDRGISRVRRRRDHAQQDRPRTGVPAPHARAHRARDDLRNVIRCVGVGVAPARRGEPGVRPSRPQSSARRHPTRPAALPSPSAAGEPAGCAAAPAVSGPPSAPCASDRMSMRQPVSFAASRAFWPSLPIASDSW